PGSVRVTTIKKTGAVSKWERLAEAPFRRPCEKQSTMTMHRNNRGASARRNPLVAAYKTGRLLNQFDCHAQLAWLYPVLDMREAGHHAQEVRNILTDLPSTLCPALSVEGEAQLRDDLSSRRDDWNDRFASSDHLDSVKADAEALQSELTEA